MNDGQKKSPAATGDNQTKMYWNNLNANFFEAQRRMAEYPKHSGSCPRCIDQYDCHCDE